MFEQPTVITKETALQGRATPIPITESHFVKGTPLDSAIPKGFEVIILGLGCFWGAERLFWQLEGVSSTSVGYSGGYTQNPTYKEVCTGQTGHTEVVRIVFEPSIISLTQLLNQFWENHDPTQGMRQGNDQGTQYRSAIYTSDEEQLNVARDSKHRYQEALNLQNRGTITTEITLAQAYYFAETYHQQYLAKNPEGYCGLGGTGVCFPPNL